jgi:hypothetical protein
VTFGRFFTSLQFKKIIAQLIKRMRFEGMSEEIDTRPPMASQKLLGNLTHPCNHGIINAILRQAEREGWVECLGYAHCTHWVSNQLLGIKRWI